MAEVNEAQLKAIKAGDEEAFSALVDEFTPIIRSRAGRYRRTIPDFDDLCQEGRLALWQAVWTRNRKVPFSASAVTLIQHRMIDAVRAERGTVRRGSHWSAVSFDAPMTFDDDAGTLAEVVADEHADEGMARMVMAEQLDAILGRIADSGLSTLERNALILRALGYRQVEIAEQLGTTPGSINQALNRARKRLGVKPVASLVPAAEVVRLYKQGFSGSEIAAQYGVTPETIIRICRKRGVPIRTRGENGSRSLFQTRLAA